MASTVEQNFAVGEPVLPSLHPERIVQKYLISSTCRFIGEFSADNLVVDHAWPSFHNSIAYARMLESWSARNAYVVVFRTDPKNHSGTAVPNYDHVGEAICACLCVLYGKRFDNHGAIESSGFFHLPDLRTLETLNNPALPQNSHKPRPDCGIPLVLNELQRLTPLFFDDVGRSEAADVFRGAAKFYHQALLVAEHDTEVAYLHLVTAGEILSSAIEISTDSLIDAQIRSLLNQIEIELRAGERAARIIRSKLRSVKRRFVLAIASLIDPAFFNRSESAAPYAQLKAARFIKVLGAAYDLRSRYLHTGHSFGAWIRPRGPDNEEIQFGRPVVDDKEYGKILAIAPTYIGLERIIRYCLLRFANKRLGIDLTIAQA